MTFHKRSFYIDAIREVCLSTNLRSSDSQFLNFKNFTNMSYLGEGAYAQAFSCGKKFVLKCTVDEKDADNASKVQKYQQTRITKFFPKILTRVYRVVIDYNDCPTEAFVWAVEMLAFFDYNESKDFIAGCNERGQVLAFRPSKWYKYGVEAFKHLTKIGAHQVLIDLAISRNNMLHPKKKIPMFNDFGLYPFKMSKGRIITSKSLKKKPAKKATPKKKKKKKVK